jgi:hypothetical protein
MESMTIPECRTFLFSLGFTHVRTMAGPVAIAEWLQPHPHGPDWDKTRWFWDGQYLRDADRLSASPPFISMVWEPIVV